jgi:hypothetical protein
VSLAPSGNPAEISTTAFTEALSVHALRRYCRRFLVAPGPDRRSGSANRLCRPAEGAETPGGQEYMSNRFLQIS